MARKNWEWRYHTPEWIPAPLKINAIGDTRPGFLCIHQMENGNGMCESNTFDESDTAHHVCVVRLRGRWKFSRPCYDKVRRCPGWAGGGWRYARHKMCDGGYLHINYEDRWWKWKTYCCHECDVVVLPYMVRYTSPRAVWHKLEGMSRRWFRRW